MHRQYHQGHFTNDIGNQVLYTYYTVCRYCNTATTEHDEHITYQSPLLKLTYSCNRSSFKDISIRWTITCPSKAGQLHHYIVFDGIITELQTCSFLLF